MDLTQLANLGEFIGGVAVLVTLIYLAVQVRQNSRDVRAGNFHRITDSFNALNIGVASNNEVARIYRVGLDSSDSLTEDERVQFGMLLLSSLRIHETIFYQKKMGAGEHALWNTEIGTMRFYFSHASVRDWWRANPLSLTPEFRKFIEDELLEAGG